MRIIEIVADQGHHDTVISIAEQYQAVDVWSSAVSEDNRRSTRILVRPGQEQDVIDALQNQLGKMENARMLILPVEATIPRVEESEDEQKKKAIRSREEIYEKISAGAKLDSNFVYMVIMSTIVAAIGLLEDSVAIVIGAMVIAPLLGPNIALAFAAALGDGKLVWSAFKTNFYGVSIALVISVIIGMSWPLNFNSQELMARTDVGLDGIAIALASGVAAVLSITSAHISSLVGVMVAVALLPPAATVGLMFGAGNYMEAFGALLLLAVNIVCINLSAKLTFFMRGIRPRTWLEKQKARQSMIAYLVFWLFSLVILVVVVHLRHEYLQR